MHQHCEYHAGGLIFSTPNSITDTMGFELPELEYAYDSLEPHIDAETMELHHSKHHAGYTAKLNAAIEGTEMDSLGIEDLMINHMDNAAVRNNGGGFWNHGIFWETMSPDGGGEPEGDLANAISDSFGSLRGFSFFFTEDLERCDDSLDVEGVNVGTWLSRPSFLFLESTKLLHLSASSNSFSISSF